MPIILVSFLLLVVAIGIIMLVLLYQKKQLQYINEKEQLKASFEKEILESKLEMQEQTMKNISQEVHDNIGQVLSLVRLNINALDCNESKPVMQEKIKDLSRLTGKVIQDLRDLSKSLHSDTITEKGLIGAIEYEFDLLKKSGAFATSLIIEGEPYTFPDQKELILFRIFQEVINNIIKHAQASLIQVRVCFCIDKFMLEINDDGQGFDVNNTTNNGLGLKNIRNRSQLIGALHNIDSQPGKGTMIKIELPVSYTNFNQAMV
ncbi:sensor histidine kinase [Ilyomonas limi]|nr:ATP-binding protein [Ilyomonas limi]